MRFFSQDRNCCVDTGQSTEDCQSGVVLRADITIRYPCLVRIRLEPRRNEFIVRSRISNQDVCSFSRDELNQDDSNGIDLALLHGLSVKLLQDLKTDNDEAARTAANPFHICIPELSPTDEPTPALHPEVETMFLDVITKRKKQDEADLAEYIGRKRAEFVNFEALVSTQAEAISNLVIQSFRMDERKKSSRRSWDTDASKERSRDCRLSSNSSQSVSSTMSQERVRKRSSRNARDVPARSATAPLPKPALMTPLRKASIAESCKRDGGSPTMTTKRVMFSEQEPTQIASDHALDGSDTEDDALLTGQVLLPEADDLFDMDDPVKSTPHTDELAAGHALPLESPRGQILQDPFAFEDAETYEPRNSPSRHSSSPVPGSTTTHAMSFATSLPRTIAKAASTHPAPLSSVKDIPSFSSPELVDGDFVQLVGDTPPKGISRKKMWQQAVASSLRMSGLVLPTLTSEDLDAPLSTDMKTPHKVPA